MLRACENMMLRRILGLWDEARERRKELVDELHDFHYSKNIIQVIK
jgi:hypothetical protein